MLLAHCNMRNWWWPDMAKRKGNSPAPAAQAKKGKGKGHDRSCPAQASTYDTWSNCGNYDEQQEWNEWAQRIDQQLQQQVEMSKRFEAQLKSLAEKTQQFQAEQLQLKKDLPSPQS